MGGAGRTGQLAFDFGAPLGSVERATLPTETAGDAAALPRPYPLPQASPAPLVSLVNDAERAPAEPRLAVLEKAVAEAAGVEVEIILTENRRTMISTRRRDSVLVVRLHRMFLRAGPTVVHALSRYLSRSDARASRLVSEFIESQRGQVQASRPRKLREAGHHHDLRAIFDDVNHAEFGGAIDGVAITWGKHGTKKRSRRRSIRLGTYTRDEKLVRIHPALDAAWVPRFFVRYIVFHELLHHVEPEIERPGRTEFHTPRFRSRERSYGDYVRALTWERENLARLLRP
jgi:hypothetical protein